VVYRVRPLADPDRVEPAVTVAGSLATLVPGPTGAGTLTTTVTNRGVGAVAKLTVGVQAPAGWTVTASTSTKARRLATDASLQTTWTVEVPAGTTAGRYPVAVTATFTWGSRRSGTASSEIVTAVVTAPADGRRHLSTVLPVTASNAVGSVERDQSNGGPSEGDGSLITVGGKVYTRGLGTTAPSEIAYYLGGRCTQLVTDVGVDDRATAAVPATFTIYADGTAAASSGPVSAGDAPATLTADLTGATWLHLVTTGSQTSDTGATTNDNTDWAAPILTCGSSAPTDPVLPAERALFSFESGTEDFTIANPGDGGSVVQSTAFHTEGDRGLEAFTPSTGNWFGRALPEPLDLTGATMLKFDVQTGATGTTGEIAIQVGPGFTWCQGGLWAWTNPNSSRTIVEKISAISCPAGVTLDLAQIRAVWVFLNGGDVFVDNVRAEIE
jgi:alpha-galactosidase